MDEDYLTDQEYLNFMSEEEKEFYHQTELEYYKGMMNVINKEKNNG